MRRRSMLGRSVFGAAVISALGFGVNAATANTAAASAVVWCPGYVNSAQICTDCCRQYHGADGYWNPSTRYCTCDL